MNEKTLSAVAVIRTVYPQIRRPTLYPLNHTSRCIQWCEKRIIIDTRHISACM